MGSIFPLQLDLINILETSYFSQVLLKINSNFCCYSSQLAVLFEASPTNTILLQ